MITMVTRDTLFTVVKMVTVGKEVVVVNGYNAYKGNNG